MPPLAPLNEPCPAGDADVAVGAPSLAPAKEARSLSVRAQRSSKFVSRSSSDEKTKRKHASLLNELWRQRPCTAESPYHLVCYADEFVPGNVLRQDNRRKCFGMFVTIREFGPHITKHVEAWLPVIRIRSTVAKQINGGASNVVRTLCDECSSKIKFLQRV